MERAKGNMTQQISPDLIVGYLGKRSIASEAAKNMSHQTVFSSEKSPECLKQPWRIFSNGWNEASNILVPENDIFFFWGVVYFI